VQGGVPISATDFLVHTKLRAPSIRGERVSREALLQRLAGRPEHRLTLLAAPAGWGKTTVLAAWQRQETAGRHAWFSVDRYDNDPVRFWTYVVEAIRTAEPGFGTATLALLRAPGTRLLVHVLPAFVSELDALEREVVLVIDDYHLIDTRVIHEAVAYLVDHAPATFRLALATRADPPLPLARLRARGELLELRADELRFTAPEAAELLNVVLGLGLEPADVTRLHERTEGWAAGLYLAALSVRGRADPEEFIAAFAGDDRHIVDYLGSEVLRGQPDDVRTFLLRTSVLERLCGPLCDAVTATSGGAAMLQGIEAANLFLVPLDTTRQWYRYHHLFGRLLLHELEQTEPELVPTLHRRAAAWFRADGSIPDAIQHAIAGGEHAEAVELVAAHWNAFFNQGRLATVSGWLDALPDGAVEGDPRLCVARAWLALDLGRMDEVEGWIDAAERRIPADARAETAVLRAVHRFKIGDVGRAQRAAREALDLAPPEAAFPRTAAHCVLGNALYWSGQLERAAEVLEEAVALARSAGNDLAASYALGYLSLIRSERRELDAADDLASTALRLSDEPGFAEHFVTMMAHLGRARVRERRGELADAETSAARALGLGLRGAGRLEIAATELTLAGLVHMRGDEDAAAEQLAGARRRLDACPDPGRLAGAVAAAERAHRPAERRPRSSREELTERELAVLRLLDSDLSQREIGNALYVSLNTVKTHTRGIFRKLDASSRREAVTRARALGLL
jgi:LuxR family maltose regulon positive regulatory protein